MKKFLCSLLMSAVLLISSTAMAAYQETPIEGADLSSVSTLAVALPMHYKTEITEPTAEEFADIIFNSSHVSQQLKVLAYDDIVDNIWKDVRIDIKALNDPESRKIFNENIEKYADAYVTVTSANNNNNVQFFFEVRDAKTKDMLYMITVQSRTYKKNLNG